MRELLRTNDLVRLSWVTALLREAGIEAIVLDTHTSVLEGSVSAIQRRLMVIDDDYSRASYLIAHHSPEPLGTEPN
jgi:CO dehydrogenase/acetyl-CoA synthase gamma subunit (corrinoid Fe-S protein)